MRLAEYLKKMRTEAGQSRLDLARLVVCSTEHVRRIEQGQSRPSPALLKKMLKKMDVMKDDAARAWVLLAREHIPVGARKHVDVTQPGIVDVAGRAAVEWVKGNLDLPVREEKFLLSHIKQRMEL